MIVINIDGVRTINWNNMSCSQYSINVNNGCDRVTVSIEFLLNLPHPSQLVRFVVLRFKPVDERTLVGLARILK